MPTPKRNARQNLVKNLLPATDVPDSYVDAYDAVVNTNDRTGVGISLEGLNKILRSSGLSSDDQDRIRNFVVPGGQENSNGLGRSEFNVLLALIGLGQEGEEINLDGVDERRRRLPQPKVQYIDQLGQSKPQPPPAAKPSSPQNARSKPRQDSFGEDPTADPWATSANSNIPAPSTAAHTMQANGYSEDLMRPSGANGASRTTSAFTTTGGDGSTVSDSSPTGTGSGGASGATWNSYNGSTGGFSDQPTLGGGFGDEGNNQANRPGRDTQNPISRSVMVPPGTGESVTVAMLPDKEGVFLFQHHNYEVKTIRRGSSVVRRYSDFVWLLDCLQKRYPFRRLPLLPPKRVQGW